MSEISLTKGSAMASPKLAVARIRALLTELNLHLAAVAMLLLVCIYLIVHLFFVWRTMTVNNAVALQAETAQMQSADKAAQPLRGVDLKVEKATAQADEFADKRLPFAVSQVLMEVGGVAKHEGVRLTRSQYTYEPVLAGTAHELMRVQMDVSLSGDYRPLVHVVNALERDKVFFLIESMTLTGQQSGTVNLRLRMSTYQRAAKAGEVAKDIELGDTWQGPASAPMPQPVQPVRPAEPFFQQPQQPAAVQPQRPQAVTPQQRPAAPVPNPNGPRTPLMRIVPGRAGLSLPGRNNQPQQGPPAQQGGSQP